VGDRRPPKDTVPVLVPCPKCGFENTFWGYAADGEILEHFGRNCHGTLEDPRTGAIQACDFRFRRKLCHACGCENDVTARVCEKCRAELIDADAKLKEAKLSKNAHVLTPDRITFEERKDKNGNPYLDVRYYDHDGQYVSEAHFFGSNAAIQKFNIDFLRSHLRRPELAGALRNPFDVVKYQKLLRLPAFVIARKRDKFWKITEKVFSEEL
jgi:DNA repair protein RadD